VVSRPGARLVRPERSLVAVPLTQRGAAYLDEAMKVEQLNALILAVGILADRRGQRAFPSAQEIARRSRGEVVALPSPEAPPPPPPGKLGYFTDGGRKLAVAMLSRLGRRLFIEYDADTNTLRTNVHEYLGEGID